MGSHGLLRWLAPALLLMAVAGDAVPQVPSHKPGTICFTRTFWCWANPPGRPGALCYCPSPRGPVQGKLG
jgi:hypothetical protein